MQVSNFFLLVTVVTTVTAQPECLDGQLRLPDHEVPTLLEYCHHGEWRWFCYDGSQWNVARSEAICVQLGYSNKFVYKTKLIGLVTGDSQNGSRRVVTLSDCNGPGLTECMVTPSDSCNSLVRLTCSTVNTCIVGKTRLVGGSTDRKGRVEVCVGGRRWRTVCTGNQDLAVLARGVCLRIDIQSLVLERSTVAVTNSFPPGAFPEYSLECTQQSDGNLQCSLNQQQCDSFVELQVVCKNYEDLRNECSRTSTLSTLSTSVHATTPLPRTTCGPIKQCTGNSTIFIAGIGVLVALLLAVTVGWILSCVIFLLKKGQTVHKQHVDAGTISTRSNQSYTQQNINTQLYAEATPPDTTYSRLNRSDKQTEEIATYDYADPNQIRVERSQATNPPPVSGETIVREKEFYIAEDHTYAAVNKKAKKKKKPKIAESDGKGESEAPPPFVSTLAEV